MKFSFLFSIVKARRNTQKSPCVLGRRGDDSTVIIERHLYSTKTDKPLALLLSDGLLLLFTRKRNKKKNLFFSPNVVLLWDSPVRLFSLSVAALKSISVISPTPLRDKRLTGRKKKFVAGIYKRNEK